MGSILIIILVAVWGGMRFNRHKKKRNWDIWSFFLGAKKTEFKIKMEAVKEEFFVPFERILKERNCSK